MAQSPSASSTSRLALLLNLAWPIVLARATQAVVGFSDALMTAPLGEKALAAVTTGSMDVLTFVMLPMGTMFILQSFASQLRGRGEFEAARRYAIHGLLLSCLAGLLALAALPLLPTVVGSIGLEPEVAAHMVKYMEIRMLGVTAIVGIEALGNWYGGLGNTRVAMMTGVAIMILNLLGNYSLILPRFGLPGYGVAGAAWASTLSSWVGFALVCVLFFCRYSQPAKSGASTAPSRGELWRIVRFGLPSGVNWFLEFAAFIVFINVVVGHLGTTALAAFNVAFQINSISFMPAFGVASACAILCGEAIGQGQRERVWPLVKLTLWVTCGWMVSVGALYVTVPELLIELFRAEGGQADELMRLGAIMLAFCGVWQVFDAVGMTFTEALRAAGDTAWPMAARITLAWLLFTPLSWTAVLYFHGGVATVMLSIITYIAVLAGVLTYRFASGRWKTIELVGETELV
jgi:MATE family multidrug resistance protein